MPIKCPNCEQILLEDSESCPSCEFSLPKLDLLLGEPPTLTEHATDLSEKVVVGEIRRLNQRLSRYQRRFPQCRFAVVIDETPPQVNQSLYTFWLFNRAGLTHIMKKEGECLLILLVIDPQKWNATAMIGYGLEPLISDERLRDWIKATEPALRKHQPVSASLDFYAKVVDDLQELPAHWDKMFGWIENANNHYKASPY